MKLRRLVLRWLVRRILGSPCPVCNARSNDVVRHYMIAHGILGRGRAGPAEELSIGRAR